MGRMPTRHGRTAVSRNGKVRTLGVGTEMGRPVLDPRHGRSAVPKRENPDFRSWYRFGPAHFGYAARSHRTSTRPDLTCAAVAPHRIRPKMGRMVHFRRTPSDEKNDF